MDSICSVDRDLRIRAPEPTIQEHESGGKDGGKAEEIKSEEEGVVFSHSLERRHSEDEYDIGSTHFPTCFWGLMTILTVLGSVALIIAIIALNALEVSYVGAQGELRGDTVDSHLNILAPNGEATLLLRSGVDDANSFVITAQREGVLSFFHGGDYKNLLLTLSEGTLSTESIVVDQVEASGGVTCKAEGFTFPDGSVMTTAASVSTGASSDTDLNLVAGAGGSEGAIILSAGQRERVRVAADGSVFFRGYNDGGLQGLGEGVVIDGTTTSVSVGDQVHITKEGVSSPMDLLLQSGDTIRLGDSSSSSVALEGSLSVGPSASVSVEGSLDVGPSASIAVEGSLDVGPSATLTLEGLLSVDPSALIAMEGSLNVGPAASIAMEGSLDVGSSATIALEGLLDVGSSALIALEGSMNVGPSALIAMEGSLNVGPAASVAMEGSLDVGSSATVALGGSLDVGEGATVTINSDTASFAVSAQSWGEAVEVLLPGNSSSSLAALNATATGAQQIPAAPGLVWGGPINATGSGAEGACASGQICVHYSGADQRWASVSLAMEGVRLGSSGGTGVYEDPPRSEWVQCLVQSSSSSSSSGAEKVCALPFAAAVTVLDPQQTPTPARKDPSPDPNAFLCPPPMGCGGWLPLPDSLTLRGGTQVLTAGGLVPVAPEGGDISVSLGQSRHSVLETGGLYTVFCGTTEPGGGPLVADRVSLSVVAL